MSWGATRWGGAALGVPAAVLVGALVVPRPAVLLALVVLVALVVALRRLDTWQRLYALTLVLMVGGASSVPAVAQASFYPRYVAAAALVVVTFRAPRTRLRDAPAAQRWLVGGLHGVVALAALSTAWSYAPATTAQQAVALGLLAALVHGLLVGRWRDPSRVGADLRVAYVVLVATCAASLAAAAVGMPGALAYSGRLQGVVSNPNMLAMAAALAVPLAWAVHRHTRRWWPLAAAAVPLVALLQSGSRTALVAVGVAVVWIATRYLATPRNLVPAAGVAAVVACVLLAAPGLGRHAEAVSRMVEPGSDDMLNTRGEAWEAALGLWQDRPVGGWGFGAGPALFRDHNGVVGFDFTREAVHNGYLQTLLELGVLGAVLVVALVGTALLATARVAWRGVVPGLGGVVAAGAAVQLTESATFGTGQVFPWVFWLAAAGVLALAAAPPDGRDDGVRHAPTARAARQPARA